jgi:hypothetical protein
MCRYRKPSAARAATSTELFGLGVVRPALRLVQIRAGGVVVQDGDEPGGPFVLGQALEEVGRGAGRVADLLGNGDLARP